MSFVSPSFNPVMDMRAGQNSRSFWGFGLILFVSNDKAVKQIDVSQQAHRDYHPFLRSSLVSSLLLFSPLRHC
jgi:hypothetical protein